MEPRQAGGHHGSSRLCHSRRRCSGAPHRMKIIKVALLTSIITAALVYVILEWRPLRPESPQAPEVSQAASSRTSAPATAAAPRDFTSDERNNIEIYAKYSKRAHNNT